MINPVSLFKCLGDETRYQIVCLLYSSDSYVELLAEQLGLTPGTVCFHLKKLEAAGLVSSKRSQFYIMYSLNHDVLTKPIESFLEMAKPDREEQYRKKVIASFFDGSRLKSIPVQAKKREIVLSHIMQSFDRDTYTEKQVNEIILDFYEDYCTLRRHLISDGFMTRERETYQVLKR